jgi:hypothetical protein
MPAGEYFVPHFFKKLEKIFFAGVKEQNVAEFRLNRTFFTLGECFFVENISGFRK